MKNKSRWECDSCDYSLGKFFAKCPKCKIGFGEEVEIQQIIDKQGKTIALNKKSQITKMLDIHNIDIENISRITVGFEQLDMVFGGNKGNYGLMPNSLNVFFGRPGIGKSTLLMQIINHTSKKYKLAYVSGEENPTQLKERYNRLKLESPFNLTSETNTLVLMEMLELYDILVIDSINTLFIPENGVIGGVSQINTNIMALMKFAKEKNKTILLIAHVTKQGTITGSNFFKHMVDGVFEFLDMEEEGIYRIVQSGKNRFGKSDESAIFKMTSLGLEEVEDPSYIFIDEKNDSFGSATTMLMQGNRPIFLNIESLVTDSNSDNKIYNAVGFDNKKFMQILAIITKYLDIFIYQNNVFTNVSGGLKIKNEPHIDLATIASIISSIKEFPISNFIFIGEVSLNGSIKKNKYSEIFIEHCKKMNIKKEIICYENGYTHIKDLLQIF